MQVGGCKDGQIFIIATPASFNAFVMLRTNEASPQTDEMYRVVLEP
jgi:hypothetical protein